jgi:hypothetical protein
MNAHIPLADHAGVTAAEREQIEALVQGHRGLDDIFAWGRTQDPPVHPTNVIKQDEFTHDVLVPLPSGRWLVYGTT